MNAVKKDMRLSLLCAGLLFVFCAGLYGLMAYGGIRTADGEVVFRAGEALAKTGSLVLEDDLDTWPGFAVARGTDGSLYSVFAPGQSFLLAPVIKVGLVLNQFPWYETACLNLPVSFTVDGNSLKDYIMGQQPAHPEEHALRFLVSGTFPFISALVVVIFFFIIRRLTASMSAALVTAALLALGTPLWSYSSMMFKEPLTILWILLSFYCLTHVDPGYGARDRRSWYLFLGGLFVGLGFFCHVTTILFVPFFLVYGVISCVNSRVDGQEIKRGFMAVLVFAAGFSIFTAVFCWLNYARFGNIFETGRLISPVAYGTFGLPWEGLAGFLISPGKGLLWFCPIVLASFAWWYRFHKTSRTLSWILITTMMFQWVFLSCRTDWHGGFCLGPRHLLPMIPFLLIPVGIRLSHWFTAGPNAGGRWGRLAALFLVGCVIQQVYFCLGEPVSFYYLTKQHALDEGVSIISNNSVYLQWGTSPLFSLLEANRGPFLLQQIPLDNFSLFILVSLLMGLLVIPVVVLIRGIHE